MEPLQTLLLETLHQPSNALTYALTLQLKQLYPEKTIFETEDGDFDFVRFAYADLCNGEPNPEVFPQYSYNYSPERVYGSTLQFWGTLSWEEHTFEIIRLTYYADGCNHERHWLIAENYQSAEAFFVAVCKWNSELREEVLVFSEGYWQKSQELYTSIQNATFDNLVLPFSLQKEIQDDFTHFLKSRELYARYGIPWKRGIVFLGPPGNGKTHTIKALVNWLKVPCLYVKSFRSGHYTEQRSIQTIFKRARETTPCILIMEDLDSLLNDKNRSFFLNELDGFAANEGVIVLATTNHPERLDPAIINRPSRFDRKYHFELPAPAERAAYLQKWSNGLEAEMHLSESGLTAVAEATEGFSFAYLKELTLSALMRWIDAPQSGTMDAVVLEQCGVLREQMHSMNQAFEAATDEAAQSPFAWMHAYANRDTEDED